MSRHWDSVGRTGDVLTFGLRYDIQLILTVEILVLGIFCGFSRAANLKPTASSFAEAFHRGEWFTCSAMSFCKDLVRIFSENICCRRCCLPRSVITIHKYRGGERMIIHGICMFRKCVGGWMELRRDWQTFSGKYSIQVRDHVVAVRLRRRTAPCDAYKRRGNGMVLKELGVFYFGFGTTFSLYPPLES